MVLAAKSCIAYPDTGVPSWRSEEMETVPCPRSKSLKKINSRSGSQSTALFKASPALAHAVGDGNDEGKHSNRNHGPGRLQSCVRPLDAAQPAWENLPSGGAGVRNKAAHPSLWNGELGDALE